MIVTTTVQLESSDTFAFTPDDAAAAVLTALNGDTAKDQCHLTIYQAATGSAGYEPAPSPPPYQDLPPGGG